VPRFREGGKDIEASARSRGGSAESAVKTARKSGNRAYRKETLVRGKEKASWGDFYRKRTVLLHRLKKKKRPIFNCGTDEKASLYCIGNVQKGTRNFRKRRASRTRKKRALIHYRGRRQKEHQCRPKPGTSAPIGTNGEQRQKKN